jgi:hypothetical protein
MTTNISTLCYDFIEQNKTIFNLKQYDVDHSMNVEVLDSYINKQTCSEKYFELISYIYKQSTYIDGDTFIQQYTSNISELNEKFNNREIIVLFPYLETSKSNFFLTLYFLNLYNTILSKRVNYVFSYVGKNKKNNIIDISSLSLTKEPLFVVCDDFLYSGGQLSMSIAYLPFICSDALDIYACIVGMTNSSTKNFSKEKLQNLGKDDYDEEDENATIAINCSYNVIFPQNSLVIDKNLKSVIRDKMVSEGFYNDTMPENKQIYNYIAMNDMYILQVSNDKLYAVGQFSNLYHNLNNTLIYLFFKYPDLISTVLTMCVLYQYSNSYTVSLDKLPNSPLIGKKYPTNYSQVINKFEITPDLFNNEQNLLEIKENVKNSRPINLDNFDWVQKCSDYDFKLDDVKFVTAGYNERIELIRNLQSKFIAKEGSLCNSSILTFYKDKNLISSFTVLSNLIKSTLPAKGGRNKFFKNKKTNKKTKSKKRKTMKKRRPLL